MIYLIRSATAHQGKQGKAIEWALKVAKYFNDKYSDVNVRVMRNINGPTNQIHWAVRYGSLAAMEKNAAKWSTDAGYQDLLVEAGEQELFAALVVDNLYRVVE